MFGLRTAALGTVWLGDCCCALALSARTIDNNDGEVIRNFCFIGFRLLPSRNSAIIRPNNPRLLQTDRFSELELHNRSDRKNVPVAHDRDVTASAFVMA